MATPIDAYITKLVKIESGARSALDPNSVRFVRPYVEDDVPGIDLDVGNVAVVDAERTFWDKIVILHGLRRWFDIRGELKGNGQRVSRNYYDTYQLLASEAGIRALTNRELGADCIAHARMFFNRPDLDLATAVAPTFSKERYLYKVRIGEYAESESREKLFVDRVESLISRQNTRWTSRGTNEG